MILTNKLNLPDPIVNAIRNQQKGYENTHDKPSDFSVTQLLKPPYMTYLDQEYGLHLEEDASDMLYSLMGSAMHSILEAGGNEGDYIEKRFYREIGGYTVSGMVDRGYWDGETFVIQDWKFMSVWEVMMGGLREEKSQQLNILKWLMHPEIQAKEYRLEIISMYRDWSKTKARTDAKYPSDQVQVHIMPNMSLEEIQAVVDELVVKHVLAANGEFKPCTDEERWNPGTKYAVMKKGRKSAVKLHDNANAAQGMAADKGTGYYVEERPAISRRCADYCPYGKNGVCPHWEDEKNGA